MFDGDLAGDVLAVEGLVGREPGGGILVAFLHICRSVDGEKIKGVVGKSFPGGRIEVLSALLPGVGESDDVVYLDGTRILATDEFDGFARIGVVEGTGSDEAFVEDGIDEVAIKNDVAGVAAVDLAPAATEFVATIACLGGAILD